MVIVGATVAAKNVRSKRKARQQKDWKYAVTDTVPDDEWRALIENGLEEKRGEMAAEGLQSYYRDFSASEAAVFAFADKLGINLERCPLRGTSGRVLETGDKNKHSCAKQKCEFPCVIRLRERKFRVEFYMKDYKGVGAANGVMIRTKAVCVCSLKKTHCLGCVVHIHEVNIPESLQSAATSRLIASSEPQKHVSASQASSKRVSEKSATNARRIASSTSEEANVPTDRQRTDPVRATSIRTQRDLQVLPVEPATATQPFSAPGKAKRGQCSPKDTQANGDEGATLTRDKKLEVPKANPPQKRRRIVSQTESPFEEQHDCATQDAHLLDVQPLQVVSTRPIEITTPASFIETHLGHTVDRAARTETRSPIAQLTNEDRAYASLNAMDYYEMLQVPRNTSDHVIKKAYCKLAMKFHPDNNKHNPMEAQRKFREVSEASDVLSDPRKRTVFDQYGYDGLKNGVPDENGDLCDGYVFNERASEEYFQKFFCTENPFYDFGLGDTMPIASGLRQKKKAPAILQDIQCSLEELFCGVTKRVAVKRTRLQNDELAEETKTFKIKVKSGWKHGTTITFVRAGSESHTHKVGDVVFQIVQQKHAHYTRDGVNLIYKAKLDLAEAFDDYCVDVPTLDGRKLVISCNEVISPSSEKLVKGEGMPIVSNPNERGDLIIKFDIQFPTVVTSTQKMLAKVVGDYKLQNLVRELHHSDEGFMKDLSRR